MDEPIVTVPCNGCGTPTTTQVSFITVSEKGHEEITRTLGMECGCAKAEEKDRWKDTDIVSSRTEPEPFRDVQFDMEVSA